MLLKGLLEAFRVQAVALTLTMADGHNLADDAVMDRALKTLPPEVAELSGDVALRIAKRLSLSREDREPFGTLLREVTMLTAWAFACGEVESLSRIEGHVKELVAAQKN